MKGLNFFKKKRKRKTSVIATSDYSESSSKTRVFSQLKKRVQQFSFLNPRKNHPNKTPPPEPTHKIKKNIPFFNEASWSFHHKMFLYTFIVLLGVLLGATLSYWLQRGTPKGTHPPVDLIVNKAHYFVPTEIDPLMLGNIFDVSTKEANPALTNNNDEPSRPVVQEEILCGDAGVESKLKIQVLDTVVLQNSLKSVATIKAPGSSKPLMVRIGDKITTIAKVGQIERLKIIFKNLNNGLCEYVENKKVYKMARLATLSPQQGSNLINNSKSDLGIESDGTSFNIPRATIKNLLKDIKSILTQARATPITNRDGSLSFSIDDIVPGSIFSVLGVENGDVIKKINNRKIRSFNQVMNLFSRIGKISELELSLERDGVTQDFSYNIK